MMRTAQILTSSHDHLEPITVFPPLRLGSIGSIRVVVRGRECFFSCYVPYKVRHTRPCGVRGKMEPTGSVSRLGRRARRSREHRPRKDRVGGGNASRDPGGPVLHRPSTGTVHDQLWCA